MRRRAGRSVGPWWVLVAAVALASAGACGGGDGDGNGGSGGKGEHPLKVRLSDAPPGPVDARETSCRFDGDRQVLASGIVRNAGDKAYHVTVSVRFLDARGVRVDLASDSISDLQQSESARWDASVYVDEPELVVECLVETTAS